MLKRNIVALTALLLVTLTGCLAGSIEDLYSLPQPPERNIKLKNLIELEIAAGSEYWAPTSGNYRQSVQLVDLDGSGTPIALAFFRDPEQTLKICVYSNSGGDYTLAATIAGEGTAIGSVEYSDLNGDGCSELLVTWQMSPALKMLKVYSLRGFECEALITAQSTDFKITDMDGDGVNDLLVVCFDASGDSFAEMYRHDGAEFVRTTAPLSAALESADRVRTNYLSDGTSALFVEGKYGTGLVTDILSGTDGTLRNITLDPGSGVSGTARAYPVYCYSIAGARSLEIPNAEPLPNQAGGEPQYWVFDWYSCDRYGSLSLEASTYHCYNDDWYLVLPEEWRENLTVRREDVVDGERTVVLSKMEPETGHITDYLAVYKLTGDNRRDRARLGSRFVLLEDEATIYCARFIKSEDGGDNAVSEEDIAAGFKLIQTEWMT